MAALPPDDIAPSARLGREELVEATVGAMQAGGLVVTAGPAPRTSPFALDLLDGEHELRLRVYVRNVTHGGATRSDEEYRIQITDDEIQVAGDRLTLLLGYHPATRVFVSFDPLEHQAFGASPSVQIPLIELQHAASTGIRAFDRPRTDGVERVFVVPSDFLADHVRSLFKLEREGEVVTGAVREAVLTGALSRAPELEPPPPADRARVLREALQYVRDRRFSRDVRVAYGGRCAFCGINAGLIDGAHIVPVAADGEDSVWNGLAACPTHHRAFDDHLLEVDETYRMSVNDQLLEARSGTAFDRETLLHGVGAQIRLPPDERLRPSPRLLRERVQRVGPGDE
jgi:putative restriction endonuclease